VRYDIERAIIHSINGIGVDPSDVTISDAMNFNMPVFIEVAGVPLYPSTYESLPHGLVSYHSKRPPDQGVRLQRSVHGLDEGAKIVKYTVTLEKLRQFDIRRPRYPTQRQVMGESAAQHAAALIADGRLTIRPGTPVSWHWCHLVGFSFQPPHRAQQKGNLICGTAAFNGQMASVEAAIRAFVYEHNRPLAVEFTVSYLRRTHFGIRLRYRIYDRKSGMSHSEYYDATTDTLGDFSDYETVYKRLLQSFQPIELPSTRRSAKNRQGG
jgi:hypothetical protein